LMPDAAGGLLRALAVVLLGSLAAEAARPVAAAAADAA
jgi:hypothetical protein